MLERLGGGSSGFIGIVGINNLPVAESMVLGVFGHCAISHVSRERRSFESGELGKGFEEGSFCIPVVQKKN